MPVFHHLKPQTLANGSVAGSIAQHHCREHVVFAQSHVRPICDPIQDPELEQCFMEFHGAPIGPEFQVQLLLPHLGSGTRAVPTEVLWPGWSDTMSSCGT